MPQFICKLKATDHQVNSIEKSFQGIQLLSTENSINAG